MRILILNGHPNPQSFNAALAQAYAEGAIASGASVQVLNLYELQFDPNLKYGYRQRTEWEPDLIKAWELMQWSEHMVWVHPVWWGGLPALLKGFIDRLFLPGKAFKYRPNSVWWDKLLAGKTARVITTLDQPGWYYRLRFGRPSVNQLKRSTLEFCGIKPVKVTYFSIIKTATETQRSEWLRKAAKMGQDKK
ncbi:NAD(P)H-dependent oxidoreductase [Edaphocola aurantiacus]|uniref:NAD(P)H-dependent oxidoreductase n=1 Tax=Edaphocola aurantiacus TaxID=2601682 RepID=UPI001C98D5FF|nr:NAD(P)H-dependent oxidoreductase [Edaphocola aurantiacus]